MEHGLVFPGDAINWSSPLSRGLVGAWIPLPEQQRGVMFRDLAKKNHGTLTDGPTWDSRSHAGGFGSLSLNGTTNGAYVDFGLSEAIRLSSTAITVAAFVRPSNGNRGDILNRWNDNSNRHFNLLKGVSASRFSFFVSTGISANGATGSSDFTSGQDYFVVGTYDGSTIRLYENGKQTGTASVALTMSSNATSQVRIARSDDTHRFGGLFHAGFIFSQRALSPSEVWHLYEESLRGYPTLLNWWNPKRYSFVAAGGGGGFQPSWVSGSNILIQPGL